MLSLLTITMDGLAYGALLFLIAIGLSVTMGLMGFVHLAHTVFAMLGGYLMVSLMQSGTLTFMWCLPLAFLLTAGLGYAMEWLFYRHLYQASTLVQVLFCIGLLFVGMAGASFIWGDVQQLVVLPERLSGEIEYLGLILSRYRIFLLLLALCLATILTQAINKTRWGAMIRAAVDHQKTAEGLGIPVHRVFRLTFAIGCGLAGLGGALGIEVLGLDPGFPVKYLVYCLLVVIVGGVGSIGGSLLAALLLGVADVLGKYYVPEMGAFTVYIVALILLVIFPGGLRAKRGRIL